MERALLSEIKRGESSTLEFKSEVPRVHLKYLKTVVAFSNTKGGKIIFGVDDSRNILGISGDPYKIHDSIVDSIVSECTPYINLETEITEIEGKPIIVIEIMPGSAKPYRLKSMGDYDGVFVRIGASTRQADQAMIKELILEGSNRFFDEMPFTGKKLKEQNSDVESLCNRISSKRGYPATINDLINLNLVSESNGELIPSRGFMLLTSNPYFHARIQCARFRGTDKRVFLDSKEYRGPLEEQISESVKFILNHINYGSKMIGIYRQDSYEIPLEAIRESIINAVVHRSYMKEDSPILVAVYDDRITIVSPGSFPSNLTLEKALEGRTQCRNRAISRYFREIGLIEGWGSGLRKIVSSCQEAGLKPPKIVDDGSFVEVTLYRRTNDVEELSPNEERLIVLIDRCPKMTVKNASKELNLSEATINRMLKHLQENGALHRSGSRKTGEWVLDIRF